MTEKTSSNTLKLTADARMTKKISLMFKGDKGDRGEIITSAYSTPDGTLVLELDSGRRISAGLYPLHESIEYAKSAKESAAASASTATAQAEIATTQANNAKTSATNSANSASASAISASNAKMAETNAETSNQMAKKWAESTESPDDATDSDSSTGKTQSSKSWALYSKDNASAAKASETNSKISEINAAGSASSAERSATAAKTSEANAEASETNAAASASTATAQAETATTQANNAKTSASASATSASNAKMSEANAEASETASRSWAVSETSPDGATDTSSATGKTQSSRSWALASKSSAESASASAITATTQASSATASAKSASTSATSASDSATSAASSATAAKNSATAAATSATNANNSETQASEYKTSASDSATAAASSASSASESATNAKSAMNTANTAASSASTSATNASTSASNAAKSEVAAKTAQAAAEKARDDANSAVVKLTGVMKYAGQVNNYSDLSDVTKNTGDVWNIVNADPEHGIKAGDNVAWNGTDWDDLSGTVDLSIYAEKADYQKAITSATADGATITFNHKDGTTSTVTVNNVASDTAATKRTISLTGNATGAATFDGTSDISINTTVNESKHAINADLAKEVAWGNVSGKPNNFVDTDSTQTITGAKTLTNKTSITTTDDSQFVVPLAVQAPNLSAGHGVYINLGKEGAMYNRYSFGFHYLGNNSPYNYFSFSSYGGPSYNFDCAGNATFPGKVTAPTFSGSLNGNADTATKATRDASGNVITDTYAKKTEVTVKGVKVDGATSPLAPDSSGVVTIPKTDLSNYYTKTQVDTAITNAISAITDGDNKSY